MKRLLHLRCPLQDRSSKETSPRTGVLRLKSVMLFLLATTLLLGSASVLHAATITAMWNANSETDLAGYKLSYGTQTGVYTTTVDVGNVTSRPLTLAGGQRYYFAVRAYNMSAMISPYSAEVFFDVPMTTPSITSLSPTSGRSGTSVTIVGSQFRRTQGIEHGPLQRHGGGGDVLVGHQSRRARPRGRDDGQFGRHRGRRRQQWHAVHGARIGAEHHDQESDERPGRHVRH